MRHHKAKIAAIAIAAAAGFSGIVGAAVANLSGSAMTPPASSIEVIVPANTPATIHTQSVMVGGKTETVFVDSQGPPPVSSSPIFTGVSGKLSVTQGANGGRVAYNGSKLELHHTSQL